jgi:hypothetical protein
MVLNFGLDVSSGNMTDWKGMREKAGELNSTKAHVTNDEVSVQVSRGVTLVFFKETNIGHQVKYHCHRSKTHLQLK